MTQKFNGNYESKFETIEEDGGGDNVWHEVRAGLRCDF